MNMDKAREDTDTSVTTPDDFLSAVFGYPCRALALPCDMGVLAAELAGMQAPAFVWTKVSGRDDPAFETLAELGFRIAVAEITYERPADAAVAETGGEPEFCVRKISLENAGKESAIAQALGDLARDNLTTSRFHQDTLVPDTVAGEIKKRWAMNFFNGLRGHEMYVAETMGGDVVGFNQVLSAPDHKVIDLICTAADFRRRGVARAIVEAMFEPGKPTRVGSQANNAAADAFYRRLGFEPVGTSLCLHWHAGDTV